MVRYEFKEGASSKFWAIELNNTEFTVCYGKIGTAGQKQTKSFASAEQAKKEHDKLVAEKTKKGYQRVGGEMAASPPSSAPVSKSSETVLRKDYHVYNEATGFAVTSKRLGGKGLDGGSKDWVKAVKNGDLIPIELVQDDSFNVRVIVGGELNAQEAEEWVGRLDWKLRVPDGNLVVCGGSEYVMEEFEGEESDYMKEYVRHIAIPRGEYRATIYMYMNSVNGKSCMMAARGGDEPDPLGEWFRRTHPGKDFPAWLHNECVSDPREDPGHEKEWKKATSKDDPNENYIDFVLHLTPLEKGATVAMPAINSDEDGGDGWFSNPNQCRVPERMPLGIVAVELDRQKSDEDGSHEEPSAEIFKLTSGGEYARKPVSGSVEVPLAKLNRLYRVAWFCHNWSMPQVAITPPRGQAIDAPSNTVENIRWRKDGERLIVDYVPNGRQSGGLTALGNAFEELKTLPDGTEIDLDCANLSAEELGSEKVQGLHRYKGTVSAGAIRITEAYPVADAAKLNAALALSEQAEKGPLIDAGNEALAAAAFESLKKHPYFEENKPVKKGTALGQKKLEPLMLNIIASEVFTTAFKSDWPCFVFEDLDDEEEDDEDDDEDDEEEESPVATADSKGKKVPIRIETFLKGAGRRSYFTANIEALDSNAKKAIKEYEADVLPLGFAHVADIGCSATGDLVIRSYAQPGGTTWAVLMLAQFGRTVPEFFDTFERGATLTTTRNGMAVREELFREAFKSIWPQAKVKDMWADHQRRAEFLAQHHGARKKVEQSAAGIAGDVEKFLEMQENLTARLKVLLRGKDRHSVYEADGSKLHPDAGRVLQDADAAMEKLGFKTVGDVTHSFLCALLQRGYARGDTWAVFHLDCSTVHPPQGRWDFATYFEKGAVLHSTRFAMSKDEQKRKIFRILYPGADAAEMLGLHEKRKGELIAKWGAALPVEADLAALAKESERAVERMIGS